MEVIGVANAHRGKEAQWLEPLGLTILRMLLMVHSYGHVGGWHAPFRIHCSGQAMRGHHYSKI